MPKVTLEFEVLDKGTAVVRQLTGETEKAFARLKAAGAGAAEGTGALVRANERAAVSMRDTRQAIGAVATMFGQVSPGITFATLELGRFARQMSGASLGAKLLGGSVVATGGTVAYLAAQFAQTERIAERFAKIDQAVKGVDMGTLRSGLAEVGVEFATLARRSDSFIGRVIANLDQMRRMALRLPTAFSEAFEAETKLREGLQAAVDLQEGRDRAEHLGTMAGFSLQGRQKRIASELAQGQATATTLELAKGFARLDIKEQYEAALGVLHADRAKALRAAGVSKSEDIEGPVIEERFRQQVERLRAQRALAEFDVDEQARQQIEGVRSRAEQARAMGAGSAIAEQQARIDLLKTEYELTKKLRAENEAYLQRIGVPSLLLASRAPDPQALLIIEKERQAKLAAIEETFKKEQFAIQQLAVAEEERQRLIAGASQTAEAQRQAAIGESLAKERELVQAVEERLTAAVKAAGGVISEEIAGGFDRAAKSTENLSKEMDKVASAAKEASGASTASWEEWRSKWRVTPGPGGSGGQDLSPPRISPPGLPVTTPPPSEWPAFQHGGWVPGPIGVPRPVWAEGGERILNQAQQRALGPTINITINAAGGLDRGSLRRLVREELIPEIERALG